MLYKIKKIWKPEIFQRHGKKRKYFEGWYYKLVDKDSRNILAVIPGISIDESSNSSHSFIQIIMGKTCESHYVRFNLEEFQYSKNNFEIKIGENYFSPNKIMLNIRDDAITLNGELRFEGLTTWPVKCLSPGIMGWYAFVPQMECYHGVVSINHSIKGSLEVNNKKVDFSDGKGYIEKDWGSSFPKAWVWMQSNHFKDYGTSVIASIARIPWLTGEFTGFIIGILHNERLYRFATYTGARLEELSVNNNGVKVVVSNKKHVLELDAIKESGGELFSPNLGVMDGRISESLQSRINVRLYERSNRRKELILEDTGQNTGMEITKGNLLTRRN